MKPPAQTVIHHYNVKNYEIPISGSGVGTDSPYLNLTNGPAKLLATHFLINLRAILLLNYY